MEDKSKGHITVVGDYEYFTGPDGSLYRALTLNPLAPNGYRNGARWQCGGSRVDEYMSLLLPTVK